MTKKTKHQTPPQLENTGGMTNLCLPQPFFGNMDEKWGLCIKFPPSEPFTSSPLTPAALGAQLPSRSQCASNHSQTPLSHRRRWETERGPLDFLEKGNIGMTAEWTPSPLTVRTENDLLVEAAAFTWGLHVWSVKTITSSVCLQIRINLFTKKNSGKLILYRSCHKRAGRSSYRSASNDIHTALNTHTGLHKLTIQI